MCCAMYRLMLCMCAVWCTDWCYVCVLCDVLVDAICVYCVMYRLMLYMCAVWCTGWCYICVLCDVQVDAIYVCCAMYWLMLYMCAVWCTGWCYVYVLCDVQVDAIYVYCTMCRWQGWGTTHLEQSFLPQETSQAPCTSWWRWAPGFLWNLLFSHHCPYYQNFGLQDKMSSFILGPCAWWLVASCVWFELGLCAISKTYLVNTVSQKQSPVMASMGCELLNIE